MIDPDLAEAGAASHLQQLAWLEKLFLTNLRLDELEKRILNTVPELNHQNPSWEDLQKIDALVKSFYADSFDAISGVVIRAFVLGTLIDKAEKAGRKPAIDVDELPETVAAAAKEYKLTARETKALEYTISQTAKNLTRAANSTVEMVQDQLFQNIEHRGTPQQLAKQLQATFADDNSEFNRNWNLVAINETNTAFNAAIVALNRGEWLMWVARPDACEYCAEQHGKVFFVIDPDGSLEYDNFDRGSKEYKDRAWLWEHTIWTGKNNMGRSRHLRKRVNGKSEERTHDELFMPSIPAHPHCRCRWLKVNPDAVYVNAGEIEFRSHNEKGWKAWREKDIQPVEKRVKELERVIRRAA